MPMYRVAVPVYLVGVDRNSKDITELLRGRPTSVLCAYPNAAGLQVTVLDLHALARGDNPTAAGESLRSELQGGLDAVHMTRRVETSVPVLLRDGADRDRPLSRPCIDIGPATAVSPFGAGPCPHIERQARATLHAEACARSDSARVSKPGPSREMSAGTHGGPRVQRTAR